MGGQRFLVDKGRRRLFYLGATRPMAIFEHKNMRPFLISLRNFYMISSDSLSFLGKPIDLGALGGGLP